MRAILTIFPRPAPRELEAENRPSTALSPSNSSAPATVESIVMKPDPIYRIRKSGDLWRVTRIRDNRPVGYGFSWGGAIEKLLAELDARAVSRAPGPYLMERSLSRRHTAWFRALWAALWVMSIVLCVFVVKYIDRENTPQAFDPAQAGSINHLAKSIGDQNKQFARMIDSVETLANVVASSSVRTTAMQSVLRRLGHDLSQAAEAPPMRPPAPLAPPPQPAREEPPVAAGLVMGGHHHDPIEDVIAPRTAVVHHNENGVMDYWLMPRVTSGERSMIKVFPIARTGLGIFVHSFDEVRDYVVMPSGDWIAASDPGGNH